MRGLLLCLALGLGLPACATGQSATPPNDRVAGCWINRDAGAVTMRWLPDRTTAGVLLGNKIQYRIGENRLERYTLAQDSAGWTLCQTAPENACWPVAEGESGALEGGRAFIDSHGDTLRISVLDSHGERTIFQGRRDGCD